MCKSIVKCCSSLVQVLSKVLWYINKELVISDKQWIKNGFYSFSSEIQIWGIISSGYIITFVQQKWWYSFKIGLKLNELSNSLACNGHVENVVRKCKFWMNIKISTCTRQSTWFLCTWYLSPKKNVTVRNAHSHTVQWGISH